jgi:hypothetical protein
MVSQGDRKILPSLRGAVENLHVWTYVATTSSLSSGRCYNPLQRITFEADRRE